MEPSPVERLRRPQSLIPPLRASEIRDFSCQDVKMLEKSRAARARKTPKSDQHQNLVLDNAKSEDPAKMTHSIPDFASRNAINTPIFIPILAVLAVNTTTPILAETRINTLCDPYRGASMKHVEAVACT